MNANFVQNYFHLKDSVMIPFLKQVADYFYSKGDIGEKCFVFPNRRSMVFFRKYLAEAVADSAGMPLVAPQMYTINDLFYKISGSYSADRVRLLLVLYDCYKSLNAKAESLDDFIFWGDVLLGDFNDVDKYLVDPEQLFTNIADYKEIQDDYQYLTENQKNAIEAFVRHFRDENGRLTVNMDTDAPDVKERFLHVWNMMYPLYCRFNAALDEAAIAYEGKVYRKIASAVRNNEMQGILDGVFPDRQNFVFVGLNALNECEKVFLRSLRDAGRAHFCWDWSGDMIRNPQNRSSFFMSDNVIEFPQEFEPDPQGTGIPSVNVVSVASSVGQVKRLPDILGRIAQMQTGGDMSKVGVLDAEDGTDCAVVLPDENLLVPVLNSIPEQVRDINVTMGLPMKSSELYVMMSVISAIQLHAVCRKGTWYFYHKQVWDLFSSPLFRAASDPETDEIISAVRKQAKYYIPQTELVGTPLLDVIFRPVITDPKAASKEQIYAFSEYQKDVLKTVAPALADDGAMALELEYAKEYHKNVNVLQQVGLEVLPMTYVRLLGQLSGMVSVPFRGEPLRGLQIMGPLETRALDFRNIVIMSAGEGVFPRRNVSSSFIPPELRKGFGLPTYEYQDAVWAYYFYRMISRAENVWLMTDSRTEGLKSGEESRYIKQLEYHFGLPLKRYVVKYGSMKTASLPDIPKTQEDVDKIRSSVLSATTLQNYLACPAKFYYSTVRELEVEEEVAESLDYGMFGTIFHDVMRSLYTSPEAMSEDFFFDYEGVNERALPFRLDRISRSYLEEWINRKDDIRKKVKALIVRELNAIELSGRNLVVTDVIVRYVIKTLRRDLELLQESGRDCFEILGREIKVKGEFCGQKFKGFIDRLDSFHPQQARVVDYKTGKVLKDDEEIHDGNAEAIAEKIFAKDVKDRPKIALQFYIYDLLVGSRPEVKDRELFNSVYSTSNLFKEAPKTIPLNRIFFDAVSDRLKVLLEEMYDTDVPFRRTDDENVCKYCDFKTICGR